MESLAQLTMLRVMVITFLLMVFTSLHGQDNVNLTSYSGVYKGKPLFIQNPYSASMDSYCIRKIIINKKKANINYDVSALILDFRGVEKYSPISIHIEYSDSTCIPFLLNPEAINYHSVFSFERLQITDSSLLWSTKGESDDGLFEVESFNLGYWESVEVSSAVGDYGGSDYSYFPIYDEGSNKYRIKYNSEGFILYSEEIEHVFYPEPVTFRREGDKLILSRSCSYVVTDGQNLEVLLGSGKEIAIADLASGEYYITFNDEQSELFRKKDRVKVIRKAKPNN